MKARVRRRPRSCFRSPPLRCRSVPPAERASCRDVGGQLQQVRCGRGLRTVVLPRGITRDVTPLADGCDIERSDLGAGLLIDLGDLNVVVLRALLAEGLEFAADR